jgi:predicted nucleic acid-binding Zn ribbon protein
MVVIRQADSAVVRALESLQSLLRYVGTGAGEPYGVIGLVPGTIGSAIHPRRPTSLPYAPKEGRLQIRICSYECYTVLEYSVKQYSRNLRIRIILTVIFIQDKHTVVHGGSQTIV